MKVDLSNFRKEKPKINKENNCSKIKLLIYSFIVIWLFFTPIFLNNISHFDWGFFPALISLLLIPAFIIFLFIDLVFSIWDLYKNILNESKMTFLKRITVPFFLLLASIISLIYNFK